MTECAEGKWLLLIHQIPPKPGYFRVKIWRRLQGLGAVAIKNTVYVIPRNEETFEDFQWVLREIVQGGGDASICAASFIEGLTDEQIKALFQEARNADYAQITEEAQVILDAAPASRVAVNADNLTHLETRLSRQRKRLAAVVAVDFFAAPAREPAEKMLEQIANRLRQMKQTESVENNSRKPDLTQLMGKTWVTRKGVHVDRMACAWLIRRFIDSNAQFKFVSSKGSRAKTEELPFDMYEGEFTHTGDLCTFEIFVRSFFSSDEALAQIGQIIHDLDLKDEKFKKAETAGIGALLNGLASAHKSDDARLERGSAIFDDLYEYFKRG
jgi:hypothetical protein